MTVYLDCSATTPVLPEVAELVCKMMVEEYGNASSRTHEFGLAAKRAVEKAREQVARLVDADKSEVIFTSGATESNNIAILGLKEFGLRNNKKHIITTQIEHKAVLEPLEELEKEGFEVTYLPVSHGGMVNPDDLKKALREDTLLVSVMFVNNETGSIQPIEQICNVLGSSEAYLHVDAAQGFGKFIEGISNHRVDLISVSGHKLYAPKGIGALVARKRGFLKPPLKPVMFGGGQEKGLRPGTLASQLIAGLGLACDIAYKENAAWKEKCTELKGKVISALDSIGAVYNGENTSPFVVNFSIPGVNSEAAMVMLKGIAAVSNGSACTSKEYKRSHVLTAMGIEESIIDGSIRMSWCHRTEYIPLDEILEKFKSLM